MRPSWPAEGEGLLPRGVTVRDPETAAAMGKSRFVVSPTLAEFNRVGPDGLPAKIGVVATPCQALALAKMRTQPVTAPDKRHREAAACRRALLRMGPLLAGTRRPPEGKNRSCPGDGDGYPAQPVSYP